MLRLSILMFVAAAQTPPETEFMWECSFRERVSCSPTEGCVSAPANVTRLLLYPSESLYWRCGATQDLSDCDAYQAVVSASGAYRNFELPGRAAFAKVGPNLSVTDVVTLMDNVFVAYGTCKEGPPPIIRR